MINILGISAFYHDSAATLIQDGNIIAAAQEERFSRKKHDERFPRNAIKYVLEEANIELSQVDYIVFFEKPFLKFERLLLYPCHAIIQFKSLLSANLEQNQSPYLDVYLVIVTEKQLPRPKHPPYLTILP